jgi:hypothetical protein
MNALQSFFKKYDAVPSNDRGADWLLATDEALVNWCESNCKAWDANKDAQPELLPIMKDQRKEAFYRAEKHESMTPKRRLLVNAWFEICVRIGFATGWE